MPPRGTAEGFLIRSEIMSSIMAVRMSAAFRACALFMLLLVPGVPTAEAVTFYTWVGGASGAADHPANWSPNGIPDAESWLTYNAPEIYTVTFSNTVPRTAIQNIQGGDVTIHVDGTHAMSSLGVNGITRLEGGAIVGVDSLGVYVDFSNTTLTLQNAAQFTARGFMAGNGPASMNVFSGSRFHVVSRFDIMPYGTLAIWGGSGATPQTMSGLHSEGAPITVHGTLHVAEGGYANLSGPMYIGDGPLPSSVQAVRVGPGKNGTSPYLDVRSDLIVGKNINTWPLVGKAELEVFDNAWVHVEGLSRVGDVLGDDGCAIRVVQGGTFTASGGLEVVTTAGAGLDLRGGITHVRGGAFKWPANRMLSVSSRVGTPELWISNGVINVGPNTGSPFVTALMVGRGGAGMMRVTRPGTVLPVTGSASVGDSLGGGGSIVVDSMATLAVSGTLTVGSAGNGELRVRKASQVSAGRLLVGASPTGNGNVEVTGASTILSAKDVVDIGGAFGTAGGTGTVVIDSSAAMFVTSTTSNPALVTIHPTVGKLVVANGGILHTGGVETRGSLHLSGGSISTLSTSVLPSGRVSGWGSLGNHLYSSGTVSPQSQTDGFGRIAIGGNFSQFSAGRYEVQLGSGLRSDTLAASGTANLDGALEITLTPDFVRTPGDTFTLMTYGARNGTFSSVTFNSRPVAEQIQLVYEPKALRLVIPEASLSVGGEAQALRFAPAAGPKRLAFELELAATAEVRVAVYDVSGRHVATLADGTLPAGRHTLMVPAGPAEASGVYFARAEIRTATQRIERVSKAVLLR